MEHEQQRQSPCHFVQQSYETLKHIQQQFNKEYSSDTPDLTTLKKLKAQYKHAQKPSYQLHHEATLNISWLIAFMQNNIMKPIRYGWGSEVQTNPALRVIQQCIPSITKSQIATSLEEAVFGKHIVAYTNIRLTANISTKNTKLPPFILGYINLENVQDTFGLSNLQYVGGTFILSQAKETSGLTALQYVGGMFNLKEAVDISGLTALKRVRGSFNLSAAKDVSSLTSLQYVHGCLMLSEAQDITGLTALKYVGTNLYLEKLKYEKAKDFNWDNVIVYGEVYLSSCSDEEIAKLSNNHTHLTFNNEKTF